MALSLASPYFRAQFELTLQAEAVQCAKDRIICLSRQKEEYREYISAMVQAENKAMPNKRTMVMLRLSDPRTVEHKTSFEILASTAALDVARKEMSRVNTALEDAHRTLKREIQKFLDLQPDLNQAEYRFLLRDVYDADIESDEN